MAAARTVRRAPAAQAVPALIERRERARRRLRPVPRARAAVRVQRPARARGHDHGARRSERSPAHRRLRLLRAQPGARDVAAPAREARQGGRRVRPSRADARARRVRRRAAGAEGAARARDARPGSLSQRRDRRARRLPARPTRCAPIIEVAKLDGPLQDDAILAIGKIGDKRALEVLPALQRTAPARRASPPSPRRSACSASTANRTRSSSSTRCSSRSSNIGFQDLLRAAARALGALAVVGPRRTRPPRCSTPASPARDPGRSPIALALGTVALRNTPLIVKLLAARADVKEAALLLRDAFDMLEEDYEEERFFATVRRAYWGAPAGSPAAQGRRRADPGAGVLRHADGLQGLWRRHRRGQRGRPAHPRPRPRHLHAGRAVGDRIVRRAVPPRRARPCAIRCSSRAPTASAPSCGSRS